MPAHRRSGVWFDFRVRMRMRWPGMQSLWVAVKLGRGALGSPGSVVDEMARMQSYGLPSNWAEVPWGSPGSGS